MFDKFPYIVVYPGHTSSGPVEPPEEEEDDYPTAPVMERRRQFMKPEPKHPGD